MKGEIKNKYRGEERSGKQRRRDKIKRKKHFILTFWSVFSVVVTVTVVTTDFVFGVHTGFQVLNLNYYFVPDKM